MLEAVTPTTAIPALFAAAIDQPAEERFLAVDVVVERAGRDAHLAGDVRHSRAPQTLAAEDAQRGVPELLEAIGRSAAGHGPVYY